MKDEFIDNRFGKYTESSSNIENKWSIHEIYN